MAYVGGSRWRIEFAEKSDVGLDGLEFRVEFRVVAGGGEVAHC